MNLAKLHSHENIITHAKLFNYALFLCLALNWFSIKAVEENVYPKYQRCSVHAKDTNEILYISYHLSKKWFLILIVRRTQVPAHLWQMANNIWRRVPSRSLLAERAVTPAFSGQANWIAECDTLLSISLARKVVAHYRLSAVATGDAWKTPSESRETVRGASKGVLDSTVRKGGNFA